MIALKYTDMVRHMPDQSSNSVQRSQELSRDELREVEELKKRDAEVKAHERAHKTAGGQYIRGGVNYEYEVGPDRKKYAVGGEVSIDTSEIPDNPEATIRKMQVVRKAALAPADPSPQDRAVAAEASQKENEARKELANTYTADGGKKAEGPSAPVQIDIQV